MIGIRRFGRLAVIEQRGKTSRVKLLWQTEVKGNISSFGGRFALDCQYGQLVVCRLSSQHVKLKLSILERLIKSKHYFMLKNAVDDVRVYLSSNTYAITLVSKHTTTSLLTENVGLDLKQHGRPRFLTFTRPK